MYRSIPGIYVIIVGLIIVQIMLLLYCINPDLIIDNNEEIQKTK